MGIELARRLKRAAATVGIVATLACGGVAQAAVYQGDWDPAFGSEFPDLGWRGTATFFVPDACLAANGTVWNFDACSNWGMKLLSAEVEFYSLSQPGNPTLETLFFNEPSSLVASMSIENGMLTGVVGTFGYLVPSTLPLAGGPNTSFVLGFDDNIALLAFKEWGPCAYRFLGERCLVDWGISDRQNADGSPLISFRTVSAIPEPGTSALMLLSLGLLAVVTRRRKALLPA